MDAALINRSLGRTLVKYKQTSLRMAHSIVYCNARIVVCNGNSGITDFDNLSAKDREAIKEYVAEKT